MAGYSRFGRQSEKISNMIVQATTTKKRVPTRKAPPKAPIRRSPPPAGKPTAKPTATTAKLKPRDQTTRHKGRFSGPKDRIAEAESNGVMPDGRTPEEMRVRQEAFLDAYEKCLCNVTLACKSIGINRQTVWRWRNDDEDGEAFVAEMDAKKSLRIDFVETALMKNVRQGNVAAQIFFLKCQAKDRGYVEKHEHSGPNGGSIPLDVKAVREEIPDAALKSALEQMADDDPDFLKGLSDT